MKIEKVGIIGSGTMGLGIAHVVAQAGVPVVVVKATPGPTDKAQVSLEKGLARLVERGKMEAAERDATLIVPTRFTAMTLAKMPGSCALG